MCVCQIVHNSSVVKSLEQVLPERYHHLVHINQMALERVEQAVIEILTPLV